MTSRFDEKVAYSRREIKNSQASEIVQKRIAKIDKYKSKRFVGRLPLHFRGVPEYSNQMIFFHNKTTKRIDILSEDILDSCGLTSIPKSLDAKIEYILDVAWQFPTATKYDYQQCRSGARRSSNDLYRMYLEYFGDVDPDIELIDVMRALYRLYASGRIRGNYCFDVKKMVFYPGPAGPGNMQHTMSEYSGIDIRYWGDLYREGVQY